MADYHIEKECVLYLIFRLRGGEFGSNQKLFTDPGKISPKQIKVKRKGAFYRALQHGINLFGVCEIQNCLTKGKQVIYYFWYCNFDLI